MKTSTSTLLYKVIRFPQEIISHVIWLYFRFSLTYHDIEELIAERGIIVTYETIRQWSQKFGQTYAKQLRSRRARPGDKRYMDEVFLTSMASPITGGGRFRTGALLDILV